MERRTAILQFGIAATALIANPVAALACDVPDDLQKMRRNVVRITNNRRANAGLPALELNANLSRAAQKHACWMADNRTMSHTGAGGSTMDTRITAEGYSWSYVSENVAMGQTDAKMVMQTWMQSPTHRANILDTHGREIGIGWALNGGQSYWAMVLAAPR